MVAMEKVEKKNKWKKGNTRKLGDVLFPYRSRKGRRGRYNSNEQIINHKTSTLKPIL